MGIENNEYHQRLRLVRFILVQSGIPDNEQLAIKLLDKFRIIDRKYQQTLKKIKSQ